MSANSVFGNQIAVPGEAEPRPAALPESSPDATSERKRTEALLHARLRLSDLAQRAGMEELLQAALDEAERLTGSRIGFFHFVDEDREHLTLQAWSTNTLQSVCRAEGQGRHYPISQAGVWVECFHARATVIHNDYARLPHRKGMPAGHAPVVRELVVPILRGGVVAAIIGVGNKPEDYTEADADLLRDLATPIMDLVARQQAEKELRASEARYRSYLDVTGQVGWTANADGEVVEDLPAWRRYTGQSLEEIQGWGWAEALHPEDAALTAAAWRQAVGGKQSYETEYRLRRHDGVYRHFLARGVPVLSEDGSVREWVGTCIDITERKGAEEALRHYELLASHSRDIILFMGRDGQILEANAAATQAYGYSREQLLTLTVQDLRADGTRELTAALMSEADERGILFETLHKRQDGSTFPVEVSSRGATIEGRRTLISVIRDISERKRTEDALRQSEERLRALVNEFADANEQLANANSALAEADRRKDEFLAMLAHELRNPLAPIRNAVQVLRLAGSADARVQRQRDVIERQAAHMARLLDDLLEVSRVTRGKIELQRERLALTGVLIQAVEMATPLIEARRHALHFSPPPGEVWVEGDLERLAQILGNLLNNAAKYTEEGGQIWLTAALEEGRAAIRVRDTGIGITPEMLPRVFDLFAQGDNSRGRERGGLGIGLTMVQTLVQLHGGVVEARSAGAGQGSEFIVRLPVIAAEPPEGASAAAPVAEGVGAARPRRVLVVDDLIDSAESLAELLTLWGHETQTAHSGAAALDWARWFRPDVVLLDIGMPGMDGFEVARRLRAEEANAAMLLIAMTGYGQQQDREATREAGFDAHLVKPVEMESLREILTHSRAAALIQDNHS